MISTTVRLANGATYTLQHNLGRREQEARALDIKPDTSLWTSRQRKNALSHRLDGPKEARK